MNKYGQNLSLTVFGGSHDAEIGMRLSDFPAGFHVDMDALRALLARRAPGSTPLGTARKEADEPIFLAGLDENNVTTGGEIVAVIQNRNTRSSDYSFVYDTPRPGHADFAALAKYGKSVDLRGGGHFSGRLTAPLTIAGGICLQYLAARGIEIGAHIASVGEITDRKFDTVNPDIDLLKEIKRRPIAVIDEVAGERMAAEILAAKEALDSVGGTVECIATGLPAGLGEHMFAGVEGRLASLLFSIPAVKGVEFGAGFAAAKMRGSENNDPFVTDGKRVSTKTNHCGGILGGMTNGMPLVFTVAVKPTPSIAKEQETVSLSRMENTTLAIKGRHDPCILPRVVPVVEAAMAIALVDMLLDGEKKQAQTNDLAPLREEINRIDRELVALFSARMQVSARVAEYKRASGMAVHDPVREAELLARVAALSPAETADYTRTLYASILSLSRAYQHAKLGTDSALSKEIKKAVEDTPRAFPTAATVACQGTEGAYSFAAAKKLFKAPSIRQYPKFSDVFDAIERGECRYGVLPIENSTAGSVTEIYDLMARHRFYIVRATRLAVDHCLLAKKGTRLQDITKVVSHTQALSQCADFLATLQNVGQEPMANTALAAEHVAKSNEPIAAVASRECAALFDLEVIAEHIANNDNNKTRFICISKTPEIYADADKTSVICTLPHMAGSLARTLARFDAMRINLTKLESRPIPARDFEFRFYFDLAAGPHDPAFLSLLSELAGEHEEFRYLGTYAEL